MTAEMTALADRLHEYRKMRYMGDCKCGDCQLVPLKFIDELDKALRLAATPARDVREALDELLRCANAIVGADPCDPESAEAFTMFDQARVKARRCLALSNLDAAAPAAGGDDGTIQRDRAIQSAQKLVDLFGWEPSEENGATEPHINSVSPAFNDVLTELKNNLRWIDVLPENEVSAAPPLQAPAAKAPAVSEAEAERDYQTGFVQELQTALAFWMPGVDLRLDEATRELAADDAYLLAGSTGERDLPCWGDGILERALAAESRLAEAMKVIEPFAACVFNDNGDMSVTASRAKFDDFAGAYLFLRAARRFSQCREGIRGWTIPNCIRLSSALQK